MNARPHARRMLPVLTSVDTVVVWLDVLVELEVEELEESEEVVSSS